MATTISEALDKLQERTFVCVYFIKLKLRSISVFALKGFRIREKFYFRLISKSFTFGSPSQGQPIAKLTAAVKTQEGEVPFTGFNCS